MANTKKDTESMFVLKPIELQLIANLQEIAAANVLSFICTERLAYQVTANTRFRVEDGNLYIEEANQEPPAEVST